MSKPFLSISDGDRLWLEMEFEDVEVRVALSECGGDKAPGPDGFSVSFLKAAWGFLSGDFCEMLTEFHKRGRLSKEINATFLIFIPKVPNEVDLKE